MKTNAELQNKAKQPLNTVNKNLQKQQDTTKNGKKPNVRTTNSKKMEEIFLTDPDSVTREEFLLFQSAVGYHRAIKLLNEGKRRKQLRKIDETKKTVKDPPTNTEQEKTDTKQQKVIQKQKFTQVSQKREDEPIQKKELGKNIPSDTSLPGNLRSGLENLSGIDLSDVSVHKNSEKPQQVGALAYTQGNNIYIASGQEKHLPHEGWHAVQQKQGKVKPTMQMKMGAPVNDDAGLEKEADVMGKRAAEANINNSIEKKFIQNKDSIVQKKSNDENTIKLISNALTSLDEYVKIISEDVKKTNDKTDASQKYNNCVEECKECFKLIRVGANKIESMDGRKAILDSILEAEKSISKKLNDIKKEVDSKKTQDEGTGDANSRRDYIYQYLIDNFGVNHLQACAILGNIYVETWNTYSPLILQGSNEENSSYIKEYKIKDSKGWGILQWTYYTRKKALLDYAKTINAKSPPLGDLKVQLEYFNIERKDLCKSDWDKFKSKESFNDMVESFCADYERAGRPHLKERITAGKNCDEAYKK